ALLEGYQVESLIAIVPEKNFKHYLDHLQCSTIYVTTDGLALGKTSPLDIDHFVRITTETQIYAAFPEVELLNQSINTRTAGVIDLGVELHRGPYSTDTTCIKERAVATRNTIKQLA